MDVRPITSDEIEPFYAAFVRSMGFPVFTEQQLEHERKHMLLDRSLAAFDAGAIVGTTHSHLFELTLPGGGQVPVAGVTAVSAATTHRRRGIASSLMRRQLSEAKERGEAAALLLASEGGIYGRFGYGVATQVCDVKLDPLEARIVHGASPPGRVVFVDPETADKIFPATYDRFRRTRNGSIDRPAHFWESITTNRKPGEEQHVVYENSDGEADGYARYTLKAHWDDGLAKAKLTVVELTATDDSALDALWRHLLNVDLVREIAAWSIAVDDPLRWRLAEPRALRATTLRDMYWLRPLDAPRLLSQRTYATDDDFVVEVVDDLAGGRFARDGTATGADADLRVDASALGSLVLGTIAPSELAAAGRAEATRSDVLPRLDAALVTHPRPWGNTGF